MFKRILCIGAHTDDIEVGCGGTISRFISEDNSEVYYTTFSFAEKSLPNGFDLGATRKEVKKASSLLGIKNNNLRLFDYEVRKFSEHRQEILEDLVKLNKELKPDVVFTHNTQDTHQDHEVISRESFRAFKQSSFILGCESFKNNKIFNADIYIKLSDRYLKAKLEAIKCYKSQIVKSNSSFDIIEMAARFRGFQIGEKYAECFENIRCIVR